MRSESKQMKDILERVTPAHLTFPGLKLDQDEFITLDELAEVERKEATEKLLKLREIGNSMIDKNLWVEGITYNEENGPTLNLLFQTSIVSNYKITEKTYMNSSKKSYPSYAITEDILTYLLNNKNLISKLDLKLVDDYIDELRLFKAALDNGTFYSDYSLYDTTGKFKINVSHDGYKAEEVIDSIVIPSEFGVISTRYTNNSDDGIHHVYHANKNEIAYASAIKYSNYKKVIGSKIYIHKPMLPEGIQKKLK